MSSEVSLVEGLEVQISSPDYSDVKLLLSFTQHLVFFFLL